MSCCSLEDFVAANGIWPEEVEWYSMWCLGHNFDVVACILAMAHLSWEKGFDAGRAIKSLTDAHEDIENNRHALYPDIFNR